MQGAAPGGGAPVGETARCRCPRHHPLLFLLLPPLLLLLERPALRGKGGGVGWGVKKLQWMGKRRQAAKVPCCASCHRRSHRGSPARAAPCRAQPSALRTEQADDPATPLQAPHTAQSLQF